MKRYVIKWNVAGHPYTHHHLVDAVSADSAVRIARGFIAPQSSIWCEGETNCLSAMRCKALNA